MLPTATAAYLFLRGGLGECRLMLGSRLHVGYPEIPQLRDVQTSSEDSLAGDTVEERSRALLHDWLDRPGEDDDFVMPGWDEDYHYSC